MPKSLALVRKRKMKANDYIRMKSQARLTEMRRFGHLSFVI
jgi:hypothetical protein